jgi:class 3 adenylate cyclase/tetratricopeptide (TPR) repeat protein
MLNKIPMSEIEELKNAIAALEGQRSILGDSVVEAALRSMREKLAALRPDPAIELRKLVSVLFSDLESFTTMSEKMDPEDVREILREYFAIWSDVVQQYGGVIEKFIGDAVMAVFGLKVVREDDAERAIRAALAAQKALEALNAELDRRHGLRLAMRVGIHTGLVVVSTHEERSRHDFVVVGDTVNLASRLQSASPTGGILISQDTYRQVRGLVEVQALGTVQLKGKREPVEVYQVRRVKERSFRIGIRGVEGVETPMIGREAELKRLQDLYFQASEGRERQVALVVGEAGLGKSRLLYEFGRWMELLPESIFYFKGRAGRDSQNQPFSLLRDLFFYRFQILDSDPPHVVQEKLEQGFGDGASAHIIGQLLGFDFEDSPHLQSVKEDALQFRSLALAHLSRYFQNLAKIHPVVVIMEDLHWADDSSLDLLSSLGQVFAGLRLLVVCAARRALFERRPQWGEGLTFFTRIELDRLAPGDSRRLVEEILQKVEQTPPSLSELIVKNSDGNPFYIEEIIKMLMDDRVIIKGDVYWSLDADRLVGFRVPPTLTGVLLARFDSLHPEERTLLQCASVVGRVFWDRVIAYMQTEAGRETDGWMAHPELTSALSSLRGREIIFQRDQSVFQGAQEYFFKHVLMRDVTYESLVKRARRFYHAQAARWLEQMAQETLRMDEFAMWIAGHFEQAGEGGAAAIWFQRAGLHAANRFANAEALHAFSQALRLSPERNLAGRFDLLLEREKVYDLLGDRKSQVQDLQAMEALAEGIADLGRKARLAIRRASHAFLTANYSAALSLSEAAVDLARAAGETRIEADGHLLQAHTLLRQGAFDRSREQAEQALDSARREGFRTIEANTLRHLGLLAYYKGDMAQAHNYFEQALGIYMEIGDRKGEGTALANLGGADFERGAFKVAGDYYARSLQVCREIGDRLGESRALNNLGITYVVQNDYPQAEEYYLQALNISQEIGHRSFEASNLDNLGNLYIMTHDYGRALEYHERSLQVSREIGDQPPQAIGLLNLGLNYLVLGDQSKGHRFLQESLAINESLNSGQPDSRTLLGLSFYHYQAGENQAALEHAQQALAIAQEHELLSEQGRAYKHMGDALLSLERFEESKEAYAQALSILRELRELSPTMPILAGLAQACLAQGNIAEAGRWVGEILNGFDTIRIEGWDEPIFVYLTCYRVLQAADDTRAKGILEKSYQLLHEWAQKITDPELRRSFLKGVPAHRMLEQAWAELNV